MIALPFPDKYPETNSTGWRYAGIPPSVTLIVFPGVTLCGMFEIDNRLPLHAGVALGAHICVCCASYVATTTVKVPPLPMAAFKLSVHVVEPSVVVQLQAPLEPLAVTLT